MRIAQLYGTTTTVNLVKIQTKQSKIVSEFLLPPVEIRFYTQIRTGGTICREYLCVEQRRKFFHKLKRGWNSRPFLNVDKIMSRVLFGH